MIFNAKGLEEGIKCIIFENNNIEKIVTLPIINYTPFITKLSIAMASTPAVICLYNEKKNRRQLNTVL